MIDFRYHIVSLISVFLALAVGIALGAGPLKETIGDTLTGQVEALRAEKEGLRTELDAAAGDLAASDAFVSASGERLLAGALTDRRVALVLLDEVPEEEVVALTERFAQAGAGISATVTINDTWTDPALATYRSSFAGTLVSYLAEPPAADAGTEAELAEALVSGLVGADAASPDALSPTADELLDLLAEGDRALVTYAQEITQPADAIVLVTGAVTTVDASPSADPVPTTFDARLALADAAQRLSEGAVVAGGAEPGESLVSAVRDDDDLAGTVTTVEDATTVSGQVVVPLALAASIAGQPGHFGYGDGLEVLPPVVQLPPVDRTPVVPEVDPGTVDGGAGGDVPAGGDG